MADTPHFRPVESSWIDSLAWQGEPGQLGVLLMRTRDGGVWRYQGVPRTFYLLWLGAKSKGKFYHEAVKGRYSEARVE